MRQPSLHHAQVFYPAGQEERARGSGQVHLSAEDDLHLHPRCHFALQVDDLAGLVEARASGVTGT